MTSQRLPPTIVDVRLQFTGNHGRYALLQPYIPVQGIVPLLIQEKLPASPQAGIRFAVFIQIRSRIETAIVVVQVQYAALSDIQEEPCVDTTSVTPLAFFQVRSGKRYQEAVDILLHMLIAAALVIFVTTTSLAAHEFATK